MASPAISCCRKARPCARPRPTRNASRACVRTSRRSNLEHRGEAQKIADKLNGQTFTAIRQASEGGQLYGSVSARDIADLVTEGGFAVTRSQVELHAPIKTIGQHKVAIALHPEVEVAVTLIVARNAEEAERVKRGEDVTVRREDAEVAREQAAAAAEAFFDPEALADEDEEEGEADRSNGRGLGRESLRTVRDSLVPPSRDRRRSKRSIGL